MSVPSTVLFKLQSNGLTLPSPIPHPQDEEGQSEPLVQRLWEQYESEKEIYLEELKQELGLDP